MSHQQHQKNYQGSYRSYIIGFILSVILTLAAYVAVQLHITNHHDFLAHPWIVFVIVGLALLQLTVQMIFFLHLGKESNPKWNLLAFLFSLIVVFIVVFGSLWIISNLSYRRGDQEKGSQTEKFLLRDEGYGNKTKR